MSVIRIYTNKDGWKEARLVPEDLPEEKWNRGLLIGPPDLRGVWEDEEIVRMINNALVDAGFYDYHNLMGKRHEISKVLNKTDLTDEDKLVVRNRILLVYQQDLIFRRKT
jgi:hypothetical protein